MAHKHLVTIYRCWRLVADIFLLIWKMYRIKNVKMCVTGIFRQIKNRNLPP